METSGTREKKYSCIWYLNIWSHFAINLQYTIEINSKPNKTIETQKKTIDDQSIRRPQKNQVGQTLNKKKQLISVNQQNGWNQSKVANRCKVSFCAEANWRTMEQTKNKNNNNNNNKPLYSVSTYICADMYQKITIMIIKATFNFNMITLNLA